MPGTTKHRENSMFLLERAFEVTAMLGRHPVAPISPKITGYSARQTPGITDITQNHCSGSARNHCSSKRIFIRSHCTSSSCALYDSPCAVRRICESSIYIYIYIYIYPYIFPIYIYIYSLYALYIYLCVWGSIYSLRGALYILYIFPMYPSLLSPMGAVTYVIYIFSFPLPRRGSAAPACWAVL